MKLRAFGIGVALVLGFSWGLSPPARADTKVHRIGYMSSGSPASRSAFVEAFREGLRHYGYVEGRNIVIDHQ